MVEYDPPLDLGIAKYVEALVAEGVETFEHRRKPNYVWGGIILPLYKDINLDGMCPGYKPRESESD